MSWHPHDDEKDPTANDCNYNFPQVLFAFILGFMHVCPCGRRDTRLQGLPNKREALEMA